MPLLKLKLAINQVVKQGEIELLFDDPASWRDIPAWLTSYAPVGQALSIIDLEEFDNHYRLLLRVVHD